MRRPDGLVPVPGVSGAGGCCLKRTLPFRPSLLAGHFMPRMFDPRLDVLPAAQREIWPQLRPALALSFVLYGGTGVALRLGHRQSVDFDFFRAEPLDKDEIRRTFEFIGRAQV